MFYFYPIPFSQVFDREFHFLDNPILLQKQRHFKPERFIIENGITQSSVWVNLIQVILCVSLTFLRVFVGTEIRSFGPPKLQRPSH
jgi:hypothetical protein